MSYPPKTAIFLAILLIQIELRPCQESVSNSNPSLSENKTSAKNVYQRQMMMKDFFKTIMINQADVLQHTFNEKNDKNHIPKIKKEQNGNREQSLSYFMLRRVY